MIYLDPDGVLADFDRGLLDLCGFAAKPENDVVKWNGVKAVAHYYDKLEPMPGHTSF